MMKSRTDKAAWYAEDAEMAARVDRAVREYRAYKVLRPEDSVDGKWEIVCSDFHIWADSFGEMCEQFRDALGLGEPVERTPMLGPGPARPCGTAEPGTGAPCRCAYECDNYLMRKLVGLEG
jgi:hypothetical protein